MAKKAAETKAPEAIRLVGYSADRPSKPCHNCKEDKWWHRPDGGWVCSVCHPDPVELAEEWKKRKE